jgi:heme-degrading monooxygenase HmoA
MATVTLITAFEVPPGADEPFVAGWERARDFLAARDAFRATALHRALRRDLELRFVEVATVDSPDAWRRAIADPERPDADLRFTAYAGLYRLVHEDGAPDGREGVILINPFEVPAEADAGFVAGWDEARAAIAAERGHLGTRLHRSLGPARFRFVETSRWSSPLAFSKAARQPAYRSAAASMPFASQPALYQVIRD